MLQKVKDWILLILLAIVGVLSAVVLARKPTWVKEKEKEVEKRKDKIQESKKQAEKKESDYEELKKKHDEEIKQAGKKSGNDDFDNPDDAADFVDDVISSIRRDD